MYCIRGQLSAEGKENPKTKSSTSKSTVIIIKTKEVLVTCLEYDMVVLFLVFVVYYSCTDIYGMLYYYWFESISLWDIIWFASSSTTRVVHKQVMKMVLSFSKSCIERVRGTTPCSLESLVSYYNTSHSLFSWFMLSNNSKRPWIWMDHAFIGVDMRLSILKEIRFRLQLHTTSNSVQLLSSSSLVSNEMWFRVKLIRITTFYRCRPIQCPQSLIQL